MTSSGELRTTDLCWSLDHSEGLDDSDLSLIASVDGSKVRMTPLRQTVIPPPMSAFELHAPENVRQVRPRFIYFSSSIKDIFGLLVLQLQF